MMAPGDSVWAVSHGVLLSHQDCLWAFLARFTGKRVNLRTEAYVLDEDTGQWRSRGIVAGNGFWPTQAPQLMANGNFIMAGLQVGGPFGGERNPAAVAISRGMDLTRWDVVSVPKPRDMRMWGESAVIVQGAEITMIARFAEPVALASFSKDYGRTWATMRKSNLPMAASKPYAGTLSSGQHYLIGTTTADCGNRRRPLTIAVTRPGERQLSRIYRIRDGVRPGEQAVKPASLAYPYAREYEGKLYVVYSVGRHGGNRNAAEMAVIPVNRLKTAKH
jgi:hypothetical protein